MHAGTATNDAKANGTKGNMGGQYGERAIAGQPREEKAEG